MYLGFEVSLNECMYTRRCNAMLVCYILYYLISIVSIGSDNVAWIIVLLLNVICFFKIILENTINIDTINSNIASKPLNKSDDKGKQFYIIKSALELGMFFMYSIYLIWNIAQFLGILINPSNITDFPKDSGLVKLFTLILYIIMFYEDAENIFLIKYCSADSVDAKNEIRKEAE